MMVLALISSLLIATSAYLIVRSTGESLLARFEKLVGADALKYEKWSDNLFVEWTPGYSRKMAHVYWYSLLGAIAVGLLALLFAKMVLPLLILPLIVVLAPRLYYQRKLEKHLEDIARQLPEAVNILVSSIRSGNSLSQALIEISNKAPDAIRKEFVVVVNEHLYGGLGIEEALDRARKRVDLETFTMFCTALIVHISRGGDILKVSERIATAVRELARLQKKLFTETSDIRAQEKIALVMTPLFFILVCFLHESIFNILIFTWSGNFILFVVALIQYFAYSWIRRIVKTSV
jgi:Flp pilus assembly protein TadB